MYRQKLHYFDYQFNDAELIEEFEKFINNNMKSLFSHAERMGKQIKVPWNLARSTIMEGGAYNKTFKKIVNTTIQQSSNYSTHKERHEQYIFAVIISESNHITAVKNRLEKYLQELSQEAYTWNKVYYGNYLERTFNVW